MLGAALYPLMEIAWRGRTHWSMSVAGAAAAAALWRLSRRNKRCPLWKQCCKGTLIITGIEFAAGILCNKIMKWQVWDYSQLPLNLMGQVCLLYSGLWFLICWPVLALMRKCR